MTRLKDADRANLLVEWGMMARRRDHEFTKAEMAAGVGMGVGDHFDRVLSAARDLCNERGWNLSYFHPCKDGKWRAAFTKVNANLPLPGVAQRVNAINGQTSNVRKQVAFMHKHSATDSVMRHVAKIVEMAEANTIEVNALVRAVMDRLDDGERS